MCGIAGIVRLDGHPVPEGLIRRASDRLSHRGPDDAGHMVRGNVALANRRLAIVDLTPTGRQPMCDGARLRCIVYNGEIYNFVELRRELESEGFTFQGGSDTEVVLRLFESCGARAVERLNGMFALAIHDQVSDELLIARDRYGIKPLYYWQRDHLLIFASEVKAILAHPDVRAELSLEALREYLTFQNVLSDRTLFRGIRMLPPGCMMRVQGVGTGSPSVRVDRYWDYDFSPDESLGDAEEIASELRDRFRSAVARQMMGDVEVGSYLSGGMDSGSIVAVASESAPGLATFTCGFDLTGVPGPEGSFDERTPARLLAATYGTRHHEVLLDASALRAVMPTLVWHLEDLRVGMSYPNFFAAKLASESVKVALSGAGGDELFGGYPWRYRYALAGGPGAYSFENALFTYWSRLVPEEAHGRLFEPAAWKRIEGYSPREVFSNVYRRYRPEGSDPAGLINSSLGFEAATFLHGLLVVEDKLSMAHGLEARVPFLDNDLVDLAMRIPVRYKLRGLEEWRPRGGSASGAKVIPSSDGKRILRSAMATFLPPEITRRQKQGFSAPDATWFRRESIDYIRRLLLDPNAVLHEYLSRDFIKGIIDAHVRQSANHRLLIWSLISLEWWIQVFLREAHHEELAGRRSRDLTCLA